MDVSQSTHVIFSRLAPGDSLEGAIAARLREAGVATGTLRGHGVLEHVELRTFSPASRTLGASRAIHGAVHALVIEGTIGLSEGTPQVVLRGVLSRETDAGIDTLSGVIVAARVVAMEIAITSAQDLALALAHDGRAGIAMLMPGNGAPIAVAPTPSPSPAEANAWADAVATSHAQPPIKSVGQANLPARPPARPVATNDDAADQVFPEAGDEVQHFAFGTCEVLRSDGDRLHLRVGKDGRIREIALEMLKVTQLDADPNVKPRHFRLDRRL
jgi:predicted DNA-binding protein with PD1-like motif